MWGRKGRRIAELERQLEEDAVKFNRLADQTSAMRTRIVNQKVANREMNRALRQDRKQLPTTINRARLLISGWVQPESGRHDGNHPVGECESCDVFRALAPFGQDWHRVVRSHSARVNHGAG